jgi:hypothetical protein
MGLGPAGTATLMEGSMTTFESIHQQHIESKLVMFDRLIFKGHLSTLHYGDNFRVFLWRQGIPISQFSDYVQKASAALKKHAQQFAETQGRPFVYLESSHTRATGETKEALAKQIADRDGISHGLICVLSVVQPCLSFDLRKDSHGRRALSRRKRKCLHFYYYFIDRQFGFMHVRLQSWFPMEIQVYINGREWLCRQLDHNNVSYERYDNALLHIEDTDIAQKLCERFVKRKWRRVLNRFANLVNPWLPVLRTADVADYYWVVDQAEVATDIMFKSCAQLRQLMPDILEHATLKLSAHDILTFAGRQRLRTEITTDHKLRPEGRRVKHRIRGNTIKMYDKHSVLRIETTINKPREFKVVRIRKASDGRTSRRYMAMRKTVSDLWRFLQVGSAANKRYLEALAHVQPKGKAVNQLDRLCQTRIVNGKRHARFNPVAADDCDLFAAVLRGEHTITGFRNRDLAKNLYDTPPRSTNQARRRCIRVSRKIAKLRAHKLIAKVPRSRLYRVTPLGHAVMSAAVAFRHQSFPTLLAAAGQTFTHMRQMM